MSALHISFSAEPVFHVGGFAVTNSILTSLVVSAFLIVLAILARKSLKTSGKPSRFQSLVEMVIEALNGLVLDVTGKGKKAVLFAPVIITFFLFILFNNWFGLIPGVGTIGFIEKPEAQTVTVNQKAPAETETVTAANTEGTFVPFFRAGTADLNTTIALALISQFLAQFFGFKFLGVSYLKKFFNFSNPIAFFVGILELISEISKIISYAFRLFGNIFAGEVLLSVIAFLIPVALPMPFYGLELFVGLIQALVFAMLSLVFFNIATLGHGEEH